MNHLGLACAVVLAGVFLASVWSKLGGVRFRVFVASAAPLELLPRGWRSKAAAAVVAGELAVTTAFAGGAALAVAGLARWPLLLGFLGAMGLLLAFTVVIGLVLRRGERAPCHCFGAHDTPLGPVHVVRNVILIGLAVAGSLADANGYTVPGVAIAFVAGALVAALVVYFDDLVALFA